MIEIACNGCGRRVPPEADFCPQCGRAKDVALTAPASTLPTTTAVSGEVLDAKPQARFACPHCGEQDQVQRVSALVAAQTSQGSDRGWVDTLGPEGYGMGYSNRKISVQSDLAKQLRPPSYPDPKPPARPYVALPSSSRGTWLWRLAASLLSLPSLYMALIGIAIFTAQFLYDRREYTPLEAYGLTNMISRTNSTSQYLLAAGFVVVALLLLLPMIAIMRRPLRSRKRHRYAMHRNLVDAANREYGPQVAEYQSFMSRRERAIAMWRDLYVCTRDGIVFLPGIGQPAYSIKDMGAYLWEYAR